MKQMKTYGLMAFTAFAAIYWTLADPNTNLYHTYYQIEADFNADGIMDSAVSSTRNTFGNAGGPFFFYLKNGDGSSNSIGRLFLHPLAVNLHTVKAGEGQMTVYIRGGHKGDLITYSISSAGIKELSREQIVARDGGPQADWDLYHSFFSDDRRLKAVLLETHP